MRGARLVSIATVLGCLAAGQAAFAALHQQAVCHLLTDARGDTQSAVPDSDQELDLTGGDVATAQGKLTVVLRLTALSAEDLTEPAGRIYEFDFTVGDQNFLLLGSLLPGGADFNVYRATSRMVKGQTGARAATGIGTATGVVDVRHREVRMTAPLSTFAKYAHMGQARLRYLAMFTYRAHGESTNGLTGKYADVSSSLGVGVDDAWSNRTYVTGTPSCVAVGR